MGKIFHVAEQPGTSLRQRLEHQYSRHDRKPWKMIAQVFLGQGEIFHGCQGIARLHVENPVDQHKTHGCSRSSVPRFEGMKGSLSFLPLSRLDP